MGTDEFERIREHVRTSTNEADEAVALGLVQESADAKSVLEQLARDPDPEIRGFVPKAAASVLGSGAGGLLRQLTSDVDPDVRGIAMDVLWRTEPSTRNRTADRLLANLQSDDSDEVVSSAWRLVTLGDARAVRLMRGFQSKFEPRRWEYKAADVILVALQSPDEIAPRILDHDHEHMTWLAGAVVARPTPAGLGALRTCASANWDDSCGRYCSFALGKLEPNRGPNRVESPP